MRKILKYTVLVLLLVLVVMQFIRPEKNLGGYESVAAFEMETKPSEELRGLLKANCYDCHSNHTNYPWYAEIAPVSYILADHVKDGKKHFNVSEWETYDAKKKDHKMEELIEEVEEGGMPLESFAMIHGFLNQQERDLMIQWAEMVRLSIQKDFKNAVDH